ncbi:hypothetical protein AX15_003788 [Amanita polypyramis BW_CC]|nr:hypothetical protein AX15_003788 [Amanita polypyramis BW_CC]
MDSEDDFDWEEVPVPEHEQHIEITLQPSQKLESPSKKRTTGISYAERLLRIDCHKIHTIALLANARIRNKWLNDPLLHARLLSLTPMHLQNAFAMIHKSRIPDQNKRGRMFETAVQNLADWWTSSFFDVLLEGHIRNRTYNDVQSRLIAKNLVPPTPASVDEPGDATSSTPSSESIVIARFLTSNVEPLDIETIQELLDDEGETIKSPKSLMKHALMRCASRDTSAQLFTALCRALNVPTRLVVSLQSVPWQSSIGKPKPKYQRKATRKGKESQVEIEDEDDMEEVDIPATRSTPVSSTSFLKGRSGGRELELGLEDGNRPDGSSVQSKSEKAKGKEKAKPPIRLRKQKTKSYHGNLDNPSRVEELPNPLLTPPVFWTEVFSRPDGRWLPVDPIRGFVNKRKLFDPTPSALAPPLSGGGSTSVRSNVRQENRMMYVLAFEEDGYARDVTRRYALEYSAKVAKAQAGGGGKGRQLWWARVVQGISRPYRLHRDDVEDEELEVAQLMEGMPTTLAGFKDHPLYVLTRHLKQNQVIHPPPPETHELGKFRGEPVYPRGAVVSLKTAETWMRTEGRTVKTGCQPLKMIKLRASTVSKIREVEVLREAGSGEGGSGGGEAMQGLYARSQTEPFVPDPVVDGIVPKNNFGNIDLYVPSMLPQGASHVPFKGVAKIAKRLGFDYAEAVTGFEFKRRRAFPVIEGIVITEENESALLEAYWESKKAAEVKARAKREDQAIKRWMRLIQGLRIRQRLLDQYTNKPAESEGQPEKRGVDEEGEAHVEEKAEPEASTSEGDGFLIGADDVVQAYSLPKYRHLNLPLIPIPSEQKQRVVDNDSTEVPGHTVPEYVTYDIQPMTEMGDNFAVPIPSAIIPMTMQELAEAAAKKQSAEQGINNSGTIEDIQAANTGVVEQTASTSRSRKPSRQSTSSTDAKPRKRTAPATKSRGSAKPRTAAGRSRSPGKRRRSSEDNDKRITSDESNPKGDDFESDYDHKDDVLHPRKRKRVLAGTPVPTRVLRPRRSKTQAHLG